jgi:predicted O-methyltransferase YrrM
MVADFQQDFTGHVAQRGGLHVRIAPDDFRHRLPQCFDLVLLDRRRAMNGQALAQRLPAFQHGLVAIRHQAEKEGQAKNAHGQAGEADAQAEQWKQMTHGDGPLAGGVGDLKT